MYRTMRIVYKKFFTIFLSLFITTPVFTFSFWNTTDYLTQEKNFLHVYGIGKSVKESVSELPIDKNEVVDNFHHSNIIGQWLQQTSGTTGISNQKKIESYFEKLDYIQSWTIYNDKKAILLSLGERLPIEHLSEHAKIDSLGFSTPVYKGKQLLGYVQAKWNFFADGKFPTVPEIDSLWLDGQKKVLGKIPNSFQQFVKNGFYEGIENGREKNLRFYSVPIHNYTLVFLYSAASYVFYAMRLGLFLLVLLLLLLIYHLLRKYFKGETGANSYSSAEKKPQESSATDQEIMVVNKQEHHTFGEKKEAEQNQTKSAAKTFPSKQSSVFVETSNGEDISESDKGENLQKKSFAKEEQTVFSEKTKPVSLQNAKEDIEEKVEEIEDNTKKNAEKIFEENSKRISDEKVVVGKKVVKEKTGDVEEMQTDLNALKVTSKTGFFTVGLKLNLAVSFILIFFLVGVTLIATYFFQNDSITRIQETVSDKSRVLALKVQEDVRSIQSESKLISLTFDLSTAFLAKQEQNPSAYRQQLLEQNQNIFYVAAVRIQNKSIVLLEDVFNNKLIRKNFSVTPDFRSPLQNESLFFEKAKTPSLLISNVSPIFNSPMLLASMPFIVGNDGNVQVALIVFFSMDVFVQGLEAYSEYLSYIVNERGELVGHSDPNLMVNRISFAKNEMVRESLTNPVNNLQTSYFDEDKIERIGSFSKVAIADLTVITSVVKKNALKAVNRLAWRNSLITLAALLFSVMVIYLFARTLTVPVKRLVAASNKISQGDYDIKLNAKSKDEIGVLTNSFVSMAGGLQEREKMKEAFGKFVNKQIADMAMKGEIKLGGERKEVAIFFSDIRSFTKISESLQPEQVVEFLNEYMTAMVECVEATNGVVDKYIGDAIMAVWGTPISYGNDSENAINGALLMRTALMKFNEGRGGQDKPIIKIGCGINTGAVLAGQIGSSSRMEYTVIGDAVNLASRVETLNKPFGTDILITSDTYAEVKDIFAVEKMKKITVKGKSKPQQIYAVLGKKDDPNCPKSIEEVREMLGIPQVDLASVDADKDEVKHEIAE